MIHRVYRLLCFNVSSFKYKPWHNFSYNEFLSHFLSTSVCSKQNDTFYWLVLLNWSDHKSLVRSKLFNNHVDYLSVNPNDFPNS